MPRDPPPDLAVEVDVTHGSLDKLSVYAAIGVPGVWHFEDDELQFLVPAGDRKYRPAERSFCFPGLRPADVMTFLRMRGTMSQNAIADAFAAWVRDNLRPQTPGR